MSDEYWSQGILDSRSKRPRLSNESCDNEDEDSTLTASELRSRLKDLGIKTKVRNVETWPEISDMPQCACAKFQL